ncbi:hypothetical protein PSENEW3_00003490 [Picochlorum sp. SENEW3]|nr:hypothetical protein PSENEW3_00003490 [Picochlorum sp. SENEW3]
MRRNSVERVRVIFGGIVDLQFAVNEISIWKGCNLTIIGIFDYYWERVELSDLRLGALSVAVRANFI